MRLRHIVVAALVPVVLALAVPAMATPSYPDNPPTHQKVVARGVIYGGDKTGATTVDTCSGSTRHVVSLNSPFLIRVCGFVPGTEVRVYVDPPRAGMTLVARLQAAGDGSVVAGPFRLTLPGRYAFIFKGTKGNVEGLGVGGVSGRGMSRLLAGSSSETVMIDVPAAGNLPKTGGDGGSYSVALWGAGFVLLGSMLVLVYARRRRSTPTETAA